MSRILWVAIGSIVVGIVVLILKYIAYLSTGSVALYSDAMESIINVVTSCVTLVAVIISAHPPDEKHPYGHSKVEYLSAVLQGSFIILAAVLILFEVINHLRSDAVTEFSSSGLWINFLASVLNGLWAWLLLFTAKRIKSPALNADGKHLLSDVVTSVGVLFGVGLVYLTGWMWMDSAIAGLVALHILWSGWSLMKDSVDGLMDRAAPLSEQEIIKTIITDYGSGAIQAHDLRTRRAGAMLFIEFHLVVPSEMTVSCSHAICDVIEKALIQQFESVMVSIHVEPHENIEYTDAVVISVPS